MPAPAPRLATPSGGPAPGRRQGLTQVWVQRELLWRFVVTDLRHRYLGSSLGFFWTVVTPLLELVIYTFVFHGLIGVRFHPQGGWYHYALFLFSGMVTWYALADGLSRATTAVTESGHLIKKVDFPTVLLPAHLVASAVLNQVIRVGVLAAVALALGHGLSWHLLLVPVFVLVQAVLVFGMALVLCTLQVFFRDTVHWVRSALLLGMFVTPVFFPAAAYPERFKLLLQLNPMAHLVGVFHELVLNHRLPHPVSMGVPVAMAALSLGIGWSVFARHRDRFADLI